MKGIFYGIGVGPGDPELITLKGINTIKSLDVIICPKSHKEKESTALKIAKDYLSKKVEVIHLTFPMSYHQQELHKHWQTNSEIIIEKIKLGKKVGFLTLGDPMLYSTYMYLIPLLKEKGVAIETIPGITSYSAVASRVNLPLASQDESVAIVPLKGAVENLDCFIELFDNLVVMKPSNYATILAEKLRANNLEDNFVMISQCGKKQESITYNIDDLNKETPYFSTIVIKKGGVK